MIYKDLVFPKVSARPFFYTSFAATIDGKVHVRKNGYWPIASNVDYQFFTLLRAHADCIIDGKNTALEFGKNTIDTIHSANFQNLRKKLHKLEKITYIVLSKHKEELENKLQNPYLFQPIVFTKDLEELLRFLQRRKLERIFIDGGPHLVGSFLEKKLLDEIFLTIAPKIFGSSDKTLTMVEGRLFAPLEIKKLKLVSLRKVQEEVFLRYKLG